MGTELKLHACDRCGNPSSRELGAHWYCDSCYQDLSSSDLEEGGDDLWAESEIPEKPAA